MSFFGDDFANNGSFCVDFSIDEFLEFYDIFVDQPILSSEEKQSFESNNIQIFQLFMNLIQNINQLKSDKKNSIINSDEKLLFVLKTFMKSKQEEYFTSLHMYQKAQDIFADIEKNKFSDIISNSIDVSTENIEYLTNFISYYLVIKDIATQLENIAYKLDN